jgi:hypothetical protein
MTRELRGFDLGRLDGKRIAFDKVCENPRP